MEHPYNQVGLQPYMAPPFLLPMISLAIAAVRMLLPVHVRTAKRLCM